MEKVYYDEYNKIYVGLKDLSRAVNGYAGQVPQKLKAMEERYLLDNSIYTKIDRKKIEYFGKAYMYKCYLTFLHLEQLWALNRMGNTSTMLLKDVLNNIYDSHHLIKDELLLASLAIEGFIIQGSAFLDFYILYLCSIFRIKVTGNLKPNKFIEILQNVTEEPYKTRAEKVRMYFEKSVYNNFGDDLLTNNWGMLLRELRNSLVHRDKKSPNFQENIPLIEKIIENRTLNEIDLPCSEFCQEVNNKIFYMVTKLSATIYGLEWKPGPYKPGMW